MVGRRYLLIGLPESGKTTFIGALWHVVQANEVASALKLHRLVGDRTYLNALRDAWAQCAPMPRTSQQGDTMVRMLLADAAKNVHELWLPDMAGETFRAHWANREWDASYDSLIEQAEGALIFIRGGRVDEPLSLVGGNWLAEKIADASSQAGDAEVERDATEAVTSAVPEAEGMKAATGVPVPWDANESPTQAQLVDLLQLLMWRRPTVRWRIAIVMSAWDEVRDLDRTPEQCCAERVPLLAQFLRSNERRLNIRYYGVSAQGGAIPRDNKRLLSLTHPSRRIEVVCSHAPPTNDITLPLRELAGDEG